MAYCAKCGREVNEKWNTCPYCGDSLAKQKMSIEDSVVLRSKVRQSATGPSKDQSISDSVASRSTITQESTTVVDKAFKDPDEATKLLQELQNISSQQVIKDSVIHRSVINQIQNITVNLEQRGFEYLVCSNPKCREALHLYGEQLNTLSIHAIQLTCDKCGTVTPYKDAITNAQMCLSLSGKIMSKIESGDIQDAKIRSYVFQRDVVDYLAEKFLKTCQFMNQPIASTPYQIRNPIKDMREIEYGFTDDEYIEMVMTDSKLPFNPYIKELASSDEDMSEGEKQSYKLRAVARLLWGLISLKEVCDGVQQNRLTYPSSSDELEIAENYLLGAGKTCFEANEKFPNETFFRNFGLYSQSLAKYVEGLRLYSHSYFVPQFFDDSWNTLTSLSKTGSFELDQTKISSIFFDPGKDRIRKKAENNFQEGATENSTIVNRWVADLRAIPGRITGIADSYKGIMTTFISNKKSITTGRIVQLCLGVPWIVYILLLFLGIIPIGLFNTGMCLTHALINLGLLGGILFVGSTFIKPKQNECNYLANQFEQLRNSEAGSTRADISVRSLHSQKVVNMLTESLTSLEGYWYNNVQGIGWVSSDLKDQLTRQLHGIPSMPPPLSSLPPPNLVKVQ